MAREHGSEFRLRGRRPRSEGWTIPFQLPVAPTPCHYGTRAPIPKSGLPSAALGLFFFFFFLFYGPPHTPPQVFLCRVLAIGRRAMLKIPADGFSLRFIPRSGSRGKAAGASRLSRPSVCS